MSPKVSGSVSRPVDVTVSEGKVSVSSRLGWIDERLGFGLGIDGINAYRLGTRTSLHANTLEICFSP